jgi:fumarate hydratase subunit beta
VIHRLKTPLAEADLQVLRPGDEVLLSGIIYTARDAAHQRILALIEAGEDLPFELSGQVIYYMGPSPTPAGAVIGACGPTTAYRMDEMTVPLLQRGLKGTIGKGKRSAKIAEAMKTYQSVYLIAVGGIGALYSQVVTSSEVIAFDDLGAEAVRKLQVKDFPLYVGIDCRGRDLYE